MDGNSQRIGKKRTVQTIAAADPAANPQGRIPAKNARGQAPPEDPGPNAVRDRAGGSDLRRIRFDGDTGKLKAGWHGRPGR